MSPEELLAEASAAQQARNARALMLSNVHIADYIYRHPESADSLGPVIDANNAVLSGINVYDPGLFDAAIRQLDQTRLGRAMLTETAEAGEELRGLRKAVVKVVTAAGEFLTKYPWMTLAVLAAMVYLAVRR